MGGYARRIVSRTSALGPRLGTLLLAAIVVACGDARQETATFSVPRPDLSAVDERVRRQLEERQGDVEALLAEPTATAVELGEAVGVLARSYHAYDMTTDARLCYEEALRLDDQNAEAHYLLGFLEQVDGNLETALGELERAADLDATPEARLRLADVLLALGRYDEAGELYRALENEPAFIASAARGLGTIAAEAGRHGEAVEHFERALAAQPEASALHYVLSRSYGELGETDLVAQQLASAGTAQVSFPDPRVRALDELAVGPGVRLARGGVALAEGRTEIAIREYRRAVEEAPENVAARINLAGLLSRGGEVAEARAHLEEALRIEPDNVAARLSLAGVLISSPETRQESIDGFTWVIERQANNAAAYRGRARAHGLGEDWPAAIADLRRSLQLEPADRLMRFELANLLQSEGETDAATRHFSQVASGDEADALSARSLMNLGNLAAGRGDYEAALGHYDAVLEIEPEASAAIYNRAGSLSRLGRFGEAADSYGAFLATNPGFIEARFFHAEALLNAGRPAEALGRFQEVVAEDGEQERARLGVAVALKRLGRLTESLASLEESKLALPRSGVLAHELALTLASSSDRSLRDGPRAVELAQRLFASLESPAHAETLAMALAEAGRFDEAVRVQQSLIKAVGDREEVALRARLEAALELYEGGEPCCPAPSRNAG